MTDCPRARLSIIAPLIAVLSILSARNTVDRASSRKTLVSSLDCRPELRDDPCLEFEPGTRYRYSNAGNNTAGRDHQGCKRDSLREIPGNPPHRPARDEGYDVLALGGSARSAGEGVQTKAGDTGLEEIPIGQLSYPLCDRARQPMPAGGPFSTAADLAILFARWSQTAAKLGASDISPNRP